MIALVLAVAGLVKVASPAPTRRALDGLGVRVPTLAVRVLGIVELSAASTAIVLGGRGAALLMMVTHAGFVAVTVASIRSGARSCGCFGAERDVAPGPVHLALNLGSVAVAVASSIWPIDGVRELLEAGVAATVAHGAVVITGAFLLLAAYTDLAASAAVLSEVRRGRRVAA